VIRVSLPWMINVIKSVDQLDRITAGIPYAEAWPDAFNASRHLENLFTQSLYVPSLRASRQPATELHDTLQQILTSGSKGDVSELEAWEISTKKIQFQTIFLAELATLPSYYVQQKGAYDVDLLLEAGERLYPSELATKVPEALFDARESGKALAFELGTACGFHAFRVLETVVRRYLGVFSEGTAAPKQRNLGVYIRALEAVDANEKVIAALVQLKDLHRNPIAHPDAAITVEEALLGSRLITSS
jgi:hypothetical protein